MKGVRWILGVEVQDAEDEAPGQGRRRVYPHVADRDAFGFEALGEGSWPPVRKAHVPLYRPKLAARLGSTKSTFWGVWCREASRSYRFRGLFA